MNGGPRNRRIVVFGGTGFFGGAAAGLLRASGQDVVIASRHARAPALEVDAEDTERLQAALRPGDVILDAAGPFQRRSTALVASAVRIGCDVVDISDSLDHVLGIERLRPQIESAGIRVLTSCSSVTTLVAALITESGARDPVRVSVFLAPASRETVRAGTSGALFHSLGRRIKVLRGRRLVEEIGWRSSRSFRMPPPVGRARGHLMESVQVIGLPRLWSSLCDSDFWVDSRVPGLNLMLGVAARWRRLGALVRRRGGLGAGVARRLGSPAGGMLVEIEEDGGRVIHCGVLAERRSYLAAVVPAVLAARALAEGRHPGRGLVPHDRHVDARSLFDRLHELGIRRFREVGSEGPAPVSSRAAGRGSAWDG